MHREVYVGGLKCADSPFKEVNRVPVEARHAVKRVPVLNVGELDVADEAKAKQPVGRSLWRLHAAM